ncbi:MAG: transporter substrate-binding protein [Spirulinaceae cyanobacterium]
MPTVPISENIEAQTVRVGILHSQCGTMAISEVPLIEAELMAIAEINATGGVLGRQIEPVIEDGASDPEVFAHKARKLLLEDQVVTVFGCWTSVTRKAVKPIFEELNSLLWYPLQYEGLETSPNIFYTGSCANQQVQPTVNWLLQNQKKRFYSIGSDYVFPRAVNRIIEAQLKQKGGYVCGTKYVPLGSQDFEATIQEIKNIQPDVVFNSLNGTSNIAFYQQYHQAGIEATAIPIMAVSVAEAELQEIGAVAAGHYACWTYFQSLDTPSNKTFVQSFRRWQDKTSVTSDPIEAAYSQVYLWRQAVELAQSFKTEEIRVAAYGQNFAAPGGLMKVEANHHVWKNCRIGKILPTGQFEIVYTSKNLIKPLPWLGLEEVNSTASEVVIDMLSDLTQEIQYSWQLEQQSRQLEATTLELQTRIAEQERTEAELRTLFGATTDLIFVFDRQGYYRKVAPTNPGFLSKSADKVLNKNVLEVLSPQHAEIKLRYIQQALDTKQTVSVEYCQVIEEQEIYFSAKVSPLSENTVIWIARNITERKRNQEAMQQAEVKYRRIFDNAIEGIFQTTPEGKYISVNPALARIYGYESPQALVANVENIAQQIYIHPQRRLEFITLMQQQGQVSGFESQVRRQDGKIIWISESVHSIFDNQGQGNLLCYQGSVQDITERKRFEAKLRLEQEKSERLLLNVLPAAIATRLKQSQQPIAERFATATIMFADLVNFTSLAAKKHPTELVDLLNQIFSIFDRLCEKYSLEKIKTIGDEYMVVGGVPTFREDHAESVAAMALDMQQAIANFKHDDGKPFQLRIGINTGPVIGGVIGTKKFVFDLWGDAVNVASRLEAQGKKGRIQVSKETYQHLQAKYHLEKRGKIHLRGRGEMISYWLLGRKS